MRSFQDKHQSATSEPNTCVREPGSKLKRRWAVSGKCVSARNQLSAEAKRSRSAVVRDAPTLDSKLRSPQTSLAEERTSGAQQTPFTAKTPLFNLR